MSGHRTGFTPEQVAAILMRELNTCAMSGFIPRDGRDRCIKRATEANHRANRGGGGQVAANVVENGCALCHACNWLIEAVAEYAEEARRRGVKLRTVRDASEVPLWLPAFRMWARLSADGTWFLPDRAPDASAESLRGVA